MRREHLAAGTVLPWCPASQLGPRPRAPRTAGRPQSEGTSRARSPEALETQVNFTSSTARQ